MTKKLHLHRETVSHLDAGSLQGAGGGKTESLCGTVQSCGSCWISCGCSAGCD